MPQDLTEHTPHDPAQLLVDLVASRDIPCPVCDYSLRDLTSPLCPECGCALELRIGSPQLRPGAWVLAIVAFALALGFDGVVSLMMVTMLIVNPTQDWQPYGIVTLFVALALAMLASLVLVIRRRPKWNRWPLARQWASSIAIFAAVGVLHAFVGACFFLLAQ